MILKAYERDGNYHATIARADSLVDIRAAAAEHIRRTRKFARQFGFPNPIFTRVSGYWWVDSFSGQYVRILASNAR